MARVFLRSSTFSLPHPLTSDKSAFPACHLPWNLVRAHLSNLVTRPSYHDPQSTVNIVPKEVSLKQDALDIFNAGMLAVEPHSAVKRALNRDGDILHVGNVQYRLAKNVYVAAFGKAVVGMVRALEDVLGDHIVEGVASVRFGIMDALRAKGLETLVPTRASKINIIQGGESNFADESSNAASLMIYDLAKRLTRYDILVVLISGGGSRLLSAPCPPITIEEQNVVTKILYRKGGTAADVNAFRRHTSLLKGGRLAQLAAPAQVLSLILSDIPGDAPELIASGPTAPDPTTPKHCLDLIKAFDIGDDFPQSIKTVLEKRLAELVAQNLPFSGPMPSSYNAAEYYVMPSSNRKREDFSHVQNRLVGNAKSLCLAAAEMAESVGYHTFILTSKLTGIAAERGVEWGRLAAYGSYMLKRKGSEADKELVKLEMSLIEKGMRKETAKSLGKVAFAAFNAGEGLCILSAGSLGVNLPTSKSNRGVGGRSQELALSAAIELDALKAKCSSSLWYKDLEIAFLCMATDGLDGPGHGVAGVFVDDNTIQQATSQGLNPSAFIQNHDTFTFFNLLADGANHLKTGVTGTSAGDLQVLLISPKYFNSAQKLAQGQH